MDQFSASPFTIPQSPAINSMPPPSFAPPSLPPPPSTDQHSSHNSNINSYSNNGRDSQNSDIKPGVSGTASTPNNNPSSQNALSFSASMLTMPTPLTQGPGTPLNLGSSTADSHLQPTLQ